MLQPKDTDWLNGEKNKTHIYAFYKKPTSEPKGTYRLKVRRWKNIFHVNAKQKKKYGVAILTSDKVDLKVKNITKDKEGHYIMIKGSIEEEDITIINIYATNIGVPQYIRQTLRHIEGEIASNTVIVGDFNTPLTSMDGSSKQKIKKETQVLNDNIRWDGSHWYFQDIPYKCRTYLLLKCTWNILQDRPHLGSQIKPQ